MSFDQDVTDIYIQCSGGNVEGKLEKIINRFPVKHRKLVGLRATYIKQKLIWCKRIERKEHEVFLCGACVVTKAAGMYKCSKCALKKEDCLNRSHVPQIVNVEIVYEAYMKEHRKFAGKENVNKR